MSLPADILAHMVEHEVHPARLHSLCTDGAAALHRMKSSSAHLLAAKKRKPSLLLHRSTSAAAVAHSSRIRPIDLPIPYVPAEPCPTIAHPAPPPEPSRGRGSGGARAAAPSAGRITARCASTSPSGRTMLRSPLAAFK